MQLSPTLRWLLGGLVAALTATSAALPLFTGVPDWLGPVLAIIVATFGALGLVPPQVGGTQKGVVNPSVVEPPAADVSTAGGPGATGGRLPLPDENVYGNRGIPSLWPVAVLPFAADRVSENEALFWIGVIVVIGCLAAAAYLAFHYAQYVGAVVLVLIAIVAAVLLL